MQFPLTQTMGPMGRAQKRRPLSSYSLSFDGTDDYVTTAGSPIPVLSNLTVSCWVKLNTVSSTQAIVFKDDNSGSDREWQLFFTTAGGRFGFWPSAGSSVLANSFGTPSIDVWYFVLAYFDRTAGNIAISVNGVADVLANASGVQSSPSNFVCGTQPGAGLHLNGLLDDVRYYDHVLTSMDQAALYAGSDIRTGLKLYWPFDEGSGVTAADAAGNGYTGSLLPQPDGPTWSTDVPSPLQ